MQNITKLIQKYKFIIISALVAVAVLTVAFVAGGIAPEKENSITKAPSQEISSIDDTQPTEDVNAETSKPENTTSATVEATTQPTTSVNSTASQNSTTAPPKTTQKPTTAKPTEVKKQDKYHTDPTPSDKPQPVEPQEQTVSDDKLECTISISCSTILDNMNDLKKEKKALVPADGWILPPEKVTINEGESVLDLLVRVCKEKKIHLEYTFDPIFNSDYIEGINNLYEFDCGYESGWMYCVNGWFPNYGVSRYVLKKGDVVEFRYTCHGYGADIGASIGSSSGE